MESKPFFDVMGERFSVRRFKTDPVEESKISVLLNTINSGPSAGNLQAYQIYLVKDMAAREALARAAWGQSFIAEAPISLVFATDPRRSAVRYGQRGTTLYALQDATIAATVAHLTAVALGLGSVWVGAFNDQEVARILKIKLPMVPIAILPIGYPDEPKSFTSRRPIADLVKVI